MKKLYLLILFTIILGTIHMNAENPIPSYNAVVNHNETFQETSGDLQSMILVKAERALNVKIKGSSSSMATIWAYSLDGLDRLGPYYAFGGETVSIPIDDRPWGVTVQSDDPIVVDVWIEEG